MTIVLPSPIPLLWLLQGAQCNHINHVSTQVPYVLTVAAISFVTYIIAGFVQNVVICLVIGILLTLATLVVLKRVFGEKAVVRRIT